MANLQSATGFSAVSSTSICPLRSTTSWLSPQSIVFDVQAPPVTGGANSVTRYRPIANLRTGSADTGTPCAVVVTDRRGLSASLSRNGGSGMIS